MLVGFITLKRGGEYLYPMTNNQGHHHILTEGSELLKVRSGQLAASVVLPSGILDGISAIAPGRPGL